MKKNLFLLLTFLSILPNMVNTESNFTYYHNLIVTAVITPFKSFWNSNKLTKIVIMGIGGVVFFILKERFKKSRPQNNTRPNKQKTFTELTNQEKLDEIEEELSFQENKFIRFHSNDIGKELEKLQEQVNFFDRESIQDKQSRLEFLKKINSISLDNAYLSIGLKSQNWQNFGNEKLLATIKKTESNREELQSKLQEDRLSNEQTAIIQTQQTFFTNLQTKIQTFKNSLSLPSGQ
jgi:hypothetical protein